MKWNDFTKAIQLYEIKRTDPPQCKLSTSNPILLNTVESHEGSAYLRPVKPYRSYIADYGIITASHSFVPLARSTIIHTPYLQAHDDPPEQMDTALQAVQLEQLETEALFPSFSSYTLYENREGVRE